MLSEKSNYSHASPADGSGKADELGEKKNQNNKPQWSWALPDNQRIHLSSHMLSISKKDMQE